MLMWNNIKENLGAKLGGTGFSGMHAESVASWKTMTLLRLWCFMTCI